MGVIATTISLLILSLFFFKRKDIKDPAVLVMAVWTTILFFSNFQFWGISAPTDDAYILIMIGIAGLTAGFLVFPKKIIKVRISDSRKERPVNNNYQLNVPFLVVIYSISLVFLLYQSLIVIRMLRSGASLAVIRSYFTDTEYNVLRTSNVMVSIQNYIVTPTVYIATAILPLEWLTGNKNRIFVISTVSVIMLWVLTSGGRSIIFWFILYAVYLFFFLGKKIFLSKRVKRGISVFLLLTLAVIVLTTISRKGTANSFAYQLYQYAVAPVSFMSHWLEIVKVSYPEVRGYGVASFYGFLYFFIFALRLMGVPYPRLFITVRNLTYTFPQEVVVLGKIRMNAFVTMFYVFFVDGGIPGVIFGCFMFALVTYELYKRACIYFDKKSILLYIMMLQRIVFSFVTFYFVMPVQAVGFIFSLFVYKKSKAQQEEIQPVTLKQG